METLIALKASYIPLVLVGGGLMFIFAAVVGRVPVLFNLSSKRQVIAIVLGICCIVVGVAPYFLTRSYIIDDVAIEAEAQPELSNAEPFPLLMESSAPDTYIVESRFGWQTAGIIVQAGDQINIEVVDGEWTPWGGAMLYSAVGDTSYICAQQTPNVRCNEPMGDAPIGMLIGRIEDQWFQVGTGTVITAEADGQVLLRINDADRGLFDNSGALAVRMTVDAP